MGKMKIRNHNILITGGSGFLGKNLSKTLSENNNVILFSRNIDNLKNSALESNAKYYAGDISKIESIRDVLNLYKVDIIIHAAASKYVDHSEENPNECIDNNFLGLQNIIRVCKEFKIKSLIAISSDKAASPHNNLYSLSKTYLERLVTISSKLSETKMVCVRFGNIAWSTGSVFPIWKRMTVKNNLILTTGPQMKRYIFSIEDAVNNVTLALSRIEKLNGKILIQNMKQAKMIDILKIWCQKNNTKYKIIKKRIGDKDNEKLINSYEINNITNKFTINNKTYYVLDLLSNNNKIIKKEISTENSAKLSKKEIIDLINFDK